LLDHADLPAKRRNAAITLRLKGDPMIAADSWCPKSNLQAIEGGIKAGR
jgi:hypothetical protein